MAKFVIQDLEAKLTLEVLIRVNSSLVIGSGHIIRCINLAKKLRNCGYYVVFLCRESVGGCEYLIAEECFELILITTNKSLEGAESNVAQNSDWLPVSQEQDTHDCFAAIEKRTFD